MEKYNIQSDKRMHPRVETGLSVELKVENSGNNIGSKILGEAINLSESGLCLASENRLPVDSSTVLCIDSPPYLPIEIETQVVWSNPVLKNNRFLSGLRFSELKTEILKELLEEINRQHISAFFGISLSNYLKEDYRDNYILEKLDQQQIMKIIDFCPPFLKIEKMAILGPSKRELFQIRGLAIGMIEPKDTAGHFNDTVFLALCGRLMASSASIHLATLFPTTAPQVIEANGVRSKDRRIWKPSPEGSLFVIETSVIKKKLELVIMKVRISFDGITYGVVDELKLFLTPKESIWEVKVLPPWQCRLQNQIS